MRPPSQNARNYATDRMACRVHTLHKGPLKLPETTPENDMHTMENRRNRRKIDKWMLPILGGAILTGMVIAYGLVSL